VPAAVDPVTGACTAAKHGSEIASRTAYERYGCRCPEAKTWIRQRPRGNYPGGERKTAVDPIAVERAAMGRPPATLSVPERIAATADLTRRGRSKAEIARLLRVDPRTVDRYRARLRAA
jgi:DNA-binding NarL/FixJ family response regulator